MFGKPIPDVCHHCMTCGEQMHGGLCGVLWSERGSDVNISKHVLSASGQKQYNVSQCLFDLQLVAPVVKLKAHFSFHFMQSTTALMCYFCLDRFDDIRKVVPAPNQDKAAGSQDDSKDEDFSEDEDDDDDDDDDLVDSDDDGGILDILPAEKKSSKTKSVGRGK